MGLRPPIIQTLAMLCIIDIIIIISIIKVTHHRHNHNGLTLNSWRQHIKLLDITHWRCFLLLSSTSIMVILIVAFASKRMASFALTPRIKISKSFTSSKQQREFFSEIKNAIESPKFTLKVCSDRLLFLLLTNACFERLEIVAIFSLFPVYLILIISCITL